jgi:tetratricopeptide (TPR) repeat protein
LIEQALRTRPFDGGVLYAAAGEALLAGDAAGWLDYARRAYRSGPRQQQEIINSLVAATADEHLPALIDAVLREFQPDLHGMRMLYQACGKRCSAESLLPLTRRLAESAEAEAAASDAATAAALWLEAGRLRGQLGEAGEAVRCAERAVQCAADNFNAHQQLAQSLMKLRAFDEAETHFRWCQQRAPNDRRIEEQLRAAMKGRLENQRRAAAGEGEQLR